MRAERSFGHYPLSPRLTPLPSPCPTRTRHLLIIIINIITKLVLPAFHGPFNKSQSAFKKLSTKVILLSGDFQQKYNIFQQISIDSG